MVLKSIKKIRCAECYYWMLFKTMGYKGVKGYTQRCLLRKTIKFDCMLKLRECSNFKPRTEGRMLVYEKGGRIQSRFVDDAQILNKVP